MKLVILAGGFGTRLSEETSLRPKPMIEIGGKPILWHIMKIYAKHGIKDFIVCAGYKAEYIKEYFAGFSLRNTDWTINLQSGSIKILSKTDADWNVTIVDTGLNTMTGGRLLRVKEYLSEEDRFLFTYGDGVGDINITELIKFHVDHGKKATVTGAFPPGRFGALSMEGDTITSFNEKPAGDGAMVNAGFFVLNKDVLNLIDGDETTWEQEPLNSLARHGELKCFRHDGFWKPMDTLRDKNELEKLWSTGAAPWKIW